MSPEKPPAGYKVVLTNAHMVGSTTIPFQDALLRSCQVIMQWHLTTKSLFLVVTRARRMHIVARAHWCIVEAFT